MIKRISINGQPRIVFSFQKRLLEWRYGADFSVKVHPDNRLPREFWIKLYAGQYTATALALQPFKQRSTAIQKPPDKTMITIYNQVKLTSTHRLHNRGLKSFLGKTGIVMHLNKTFRGDEALVDFGGVGHNQYWINFKYLEKQQQQ